MPNQDERRVIKMSWSILSKAAERSSKQRHKVIMDVQKSCFGRMMFAVG